MSIPVGAGPAALGSAYTALATDAYASIWNPAGLGFVEGPQAAAQHLSYLESINYEFFSVAIPIRNGDALGASAQYLGSGSITSLDQSGQNIGSYTDTFGAYSLAYGHAFSDRLSLGITTKLIHVQLNDVHANAFAVDLGSLYKVNRKLNLAVALNNAGSKLTFLSDGDSLPLALHLSAAYAPIPHWLFSSEVLIPKGDPAGWHMGIEWRPTSLFSLRTGYRTDTTNDLSALAGFSTGAGINLWGQEFAYAWVPYATLGDTHYFSLLIRFGGSQDLRKNLSSPMHNAGEETLR